MKRAPQIVFFSVFILLFSNFGCSTAANTNNQTNSTPAKSNTNANKEKAAVKDDIEELETIVKLPFHPEEALWRDEPLGTQTGENRVPSQNERKLLCILKFKPDEAEKIVESAAKHKPAQAFEMEPESWFPPELIAQSQASGNETIKGNSYGANDFYQSPYLDGKVTRISGTNFFILELFSK